MGSKNSKSKESFEAIIVKPNGGLGNQLFEIANGYAYAKRYNKRFYICSSWKGITKDRPTYWNTCLKNLKQYLIIPKRINTIKVYKEPRFSYSKIENFKGHICFEGYFQSEKYFLENKNIIIKEIFPLKSKNKLFINMKNKISNCNSVSLSIRSYENEIFNINRFGGIAPHEFYSNAVNLILKEVCNPNFFVFSTKINNTKNILDKIPILNKYKFSFITGDLGYNDANDTLWLMSYCKHHIISNSSLYWWGAYFSRLRYKKNKIICSGNYPNKDTCLNNWKLNNF
jgi:hypothetical protein